MTRKSFRARALALASLGILGASAAFPQQPSWHWPEKSKNLQVLPKDCDAEKLQAIMKGFTRSLGVRCTHCHVGQEGQPLSTYDFVSDQNPNKDRAREMYRMLGDINGHLKKITPSGDQRVNMWCGTCHHGRPRPMTLAEELGQTYRRAGIQATLARYGELREKFYGRGSYDFGERSLDDFGGDLVELGHREDAIEILRLNTAQFPQSGDAWQSLAEAYEGGGHREIAAIYFRKAVEVDPSNDEALAKLAAIEGPKPK
jgi:tetratricopeptide (TPR) repeat protein